MILTTLSLCALASFQGASRPERSFRFVYGATLSEVAAGAKQVRLWIPVPLDTPEQEITKLELKAKSGTEAAALTGAKTADLKDGSQGGLKWSLHDIAGGSGRSLCVETEGKPLELELSFDVRRRETKGGGKASPAELAELTQPAEVDGKKAEVARAFKRIDP